MRAVLNTHTQHPNTQRHPTNPTTPTQPTAHLLVGKDEEHRVAELVLAEHPVQLVARLADAVAVVRVDDEDQALRVLEVVAPERADLPGLWWGVEGSWWG